MDILHLSQISVRPRHVVRHPDRLFPRRDRSQERSSASCARAELRAGADSLAPEAPVRCTVYLRYAGFLGRRTGGWSAVVPGRSSLSSG